MKIAVVIAPRRRVIVLSRLSEAAAIRGRRGPGRLAKACGERTGFAEADLERDLGDRARGLRQQRLGILDAPRVVIAVGRYAERLLERPAEMIGAQANKLRQRGERYLFGDVFFDVSGHAALLPGGEAAARWRFGATRAYVAVYDVMGQHDADLFAIMLVVIAVFDQPGQLDRGLPQHGGFEEQVGCQGRLVRAGNDGQFGGIEIEENDADAGSGLMPVPVLVARRHQSELALDGSQYRTC